MIDVRQMPIYHACSQLTELPHSRRLTTIAAAPARHGGNIIASPLSISIEAPIINECHHHYVGYHDAEDDDA